MSPTNDCIKDTEHSLLFCPYLEVTRRDLLAGVSALLRPLGHTDLSNEFLMQILLYGDKDFPDSLKTDILLVSFHFKFFIHGGPINQEWLLFREPLKKPNYNATKIKKNIYNVKLE